MCYSRSSKPGYQRICGQVLSILLKLKSDWVSDSLYLFEHRLNGVHVVNHVCLLTYITHAWLVLLIMALKNKV